MAALITCAEFINGGRRGRRCRSAVRLISFRKKVIVETVRIIGRGPGRGKTKSDHRSLKNRQKMG